MLLRKDIRLKQTQSLLDNGLLPVSVDFRLCPEVSLDRRSNLRCLQRSPIGKACLSDSPILASDLILGLPLSSCLLRVWVPLVVGAWGRCNSAVVSRVAGRFDSSAQRQRLASEEPLSDVSAWTSGICAAIAIILALLPKVRTRFGWMVEHVMHFGRSWVKHILSE